MAHRAVLEAGTAQIVKTRRQATQCGKRAGVTFQAKLALVVPDEHSGVRRPVSLVTDRAFFKLDRRMLKRERPPLVSVARQATRFIGGHPAQGGS